MPDRSPIGIFDSGIGGLTVANAIKNQLPEERIVYFGDTAHLPYGDKAPGSIIEYSKVITDFLIHQGCKIIVIACNSASSIAFEEVQQRAGDIPVINVIDPVVEIVASDATVDIVGVIGTRATINSGVYENRLKSKKQELIVKSLATPLLVPVIEEHIMDESVGQMVIEQYLRQDILSEIEALILGCTHYPLVKNKVETFYQGNTKVFDSAGIVGRYIKTFLEKENLLSNKIEGNHAFYVSDYTESFEHNTRDFFGQEIELQEIDLFKIS